MFNISPTAEIWIKMYFFNFAHLSHDDDGVVKYNLFLHISQNNIKNISTSCYLSVLPTCHVNEYV